MLIETIQEMLYHLIIPPKPFFAVADMFLHPKITLYFSFECGELCSQALRIRVNIHFGPRCRDDAIIWKNSAGKTELLI